MRACFQVAWPHGVAWPYRVVGGTTPWGWALCRNPGACREVGSGVWIREEVVGEGLCLRGFQGRVVLGILLTAGLYLHCIPYCHLPRGKSCHQSSRVTCEAPEGWEGCERLEILRALLGFCDIPMGNAPLQHVAGGWCDPPSFVPLQLRR